MADSVHESPKGDREVLHDGLTHGKPHSAGCIAPTIPFDVEITDTDDPRWHYVLPPNPSVWDRAASPCWRFQAWLRLLSDNFGRHFVWMIVFGEHLLKGLLGGGGGGGFLVIESICYLQLQVGASTKSTLLATSHAAWSLKPMYGLISDAFTIRGYRRTPWIIITAVLACAGYFSVWMFGRTMWPSVVCMCFFLAKLQLSWTDLMIEATYSEKIQHAPQYAPDIVSWVWSGIGLWAIVGVLIAGPGLDVFGPFTTAAFAAPISAAIIIPACLGWLMEGPVSASRGGLQRELLAKQRPMFLCTVVLALAVIVSAICGIARIPPSSQAVVAVVCSVLTGAAATALLPTAIWKPMLYMFLAHAISVNTYGFVDNFYLDAATPTEAKKTGYPVCTDCPHFTNTFYVTVVGVCDSLFMALGSWCFNAVMSRWTYRRSLATTQIVVMLVSLVDVVQFERLNRRFGIPDEVFMLGKAPTTKPPIISHVTTNRIPCPTVALGIPFFHWCW